MAVLRQLPRNSSKSAAVRQPAIRASCTTDLIAASTNTDWSASGVTVMSSGRLSTKRGRSRRICSMMSSVDAVPFLSTVISRPRSPSRRTTVVWAWKPSLICATSRTNTVVPLTVVTGMSPRPCMVAGEPLS